MALVRYEPIDLFDRFSNDINRMFTGSQARDATARARARDWAPHVDIREEDGRFVLYADIPGVERKDVDITLEDGVLTIKGERREQNAEQPGDFRHRERAQGAFLRRFSLPDTVNDEQISATAKDGVLQIVIPKQEQPQARRINVS
jgi:HSP20 family protein